MHNGRYACKNYVSTVKIIIIMLLIALSNENGGSSAQIRFIHKTSDTWIEKTPVITCNPV